MRRPRSLFWTLTGSIVGILALTAVLQTFFVVAVFEPIARGRQAARAQDFVEEIVPEVIEAVALGRAEGIPQLLARYQRLADGFGLVYEKADGTRVLPRRMGRRAQFRDPLSPDGPPPHGRRGRFDPSRLEEIARAPVVIDGADLGTVVAVRPDRGLSFPRLVPLRVLFALPAALLAALLGGMWIFRRLQRRLDRLESQALHVAEGRLDARIDAPGDDELGQVARQLNAMTESLASARAELESADAQRRRLLADITHEISTPLTSIRGYAETLLDSEVSVDAGERERYVREMLHAAERMNVLVTDLLDLARLEAGGIELQLEDIDLALLVHHSLGRHRSAFERAGLELVEEPAEGPVVVRADGLRLEQVVDNLLNNALRHVPAGHTVTVGAAVDVGQAELVVRDDGPGFPEEALPHVFERFYRAEGSRSTPGSGLGLAIVREIVLRHGGQITAENLPAGGACLRVRLPLSD